MQIISEFNVEKNEIKVNVKSRDFKSGLRDLVGYHCVGELFFRIFFAMISAQDTGD